MNGNSWKHFDIGMVFLGKKNGHKFRIDFVPCAVLPGIPTPFVIKHLKEFLVKTNWTMNLKENDFSLRHIFDGHPMTEDFLELKKKKVIFITPRGASFKSQNNIF